MTFEADLKAHLAAASALTDVIGSRLRPVKLEQEELLPAATYTIVFGEPQNCLDGFTSNLTHYIVQFDFWATAYSQVLAAALATRNRLNTPASSFRTVITDFPLFDDYEPETKRHRRAIQVSCWFRE